MTKIELSAEGNALLMQLREMNAVSQFRASAAEELVLHGYAVLVPGAIVIEITEAGREFSADRVRSHSHVDGVTTFAGGLDGLPTRAMTAKDGLYGRPMSGQGTDGVPNTAAELPDGLGQAVSEESRPSN